MPDALPTEAPDFDSVHQEAGTYTVNALRTIWNTLQMKADSLARQVRNRTQSVVLTTAATGTQNDFDLSSANGQSILLRCNNGSSTVDFTGFNGGFPGQLLTVIGLGTGVISFFHQNVNSAAANRLSNLASSAQSKLVPTRGFATFVYDAISGTWRMLAFDQGDWLTPAYAASDFDGGSQTWTVDAGDVTYLRYYQTGRSMDFSTKITNFTISGQTDSVMYIKNGQWGGFSSNGIAAGSLQFAQGAGTPVNGVGVTQSDDGAIFPVTKLRLNKVVDIWRNVTNNDVFWASVRFPLL